MKKLMIYLTITAFAAFMCGGPSYAGTDEDQRRLENSSDVMAPGWINIDKQRAESMKESVKPASTTEERIKAIGTDLEVGLAESTMDAVVLDLKGPKGGGSSDQTVTAGLRDGAGGPYISAIGSGTDQWNEYGNLVSEEGGRMVSEVIDGARYHYVGFNDAGVDSIQHAISIANGGIVIVKSGTYAGDISMSGRVNLYGGYSEDGTRDVWNSPTEILGRVTITDAQFKTLNGLKLYDVEGLALNRASGTFDVDIRCSTFAGRVDLTAGNIANIQNSRFLSGSRFAGAARIRNCDLYDAQIGVGGSVSMAGNNFYGTAYFSGALFGDYRSGSGGFGGKITSYDSFFESPWTTITGTTTFENSEMRIVTITDKAHERSALADYSSPTLRTERPADSVTPSNDTKTANPWLAKDKRYTGNGFRDTFASTLIMNGGFETPLTKAEVTSILKGLLANKDALMSGKEGALDPALIARLVAEALQESALAVPVGELTSQEMEMAMMLANIIKNPTAEQKEMLDAITALLSNLEKAEKSTKDPEAAEKSTEEFAEIAAVALIAQALPDLFSEGDMAKVKGLFGNMNGLVADIVGRYEASVGEYYDELKKDIAANLTLLQLTNVLSKEMTEGDIDKLPSSRLDRILEKIRQVKEKTVSEKQILAQEKKYRAKYIEPQTKLMEENIKKTMGEFSKEINLLLKVGSEK